MTSKRKESLHDGWLLAVEILDDGKIQLKCKTIKEERITFILSGAKFLEVNNFREGNIILDYENVPVDESNTNEMVELFYDNRSSEDARTVLVQQAISEKWRIFRINPSYGATVIAICESVQVE